MRIHSLKPYVLMSLSVAAVMSGCVLEDPCDIDEIYSREQGSCVKCANLPGYHLDKRNFCALDKTEECGASMTNCMSSGVAEASCDNGECRIARCEDGYKVKGGTCEPCGEDEVLVDHQCTKCLNLIGYHLDESGKCAEDELTSCGAGRMDCSGIAGAVNAECVGGTCVFDCDTELGWKKDGGFCVQNEAYSCGEEGNMINCMTAWRSEIYGENPDWIRATGPLCEGGKCTLNMCDAGYFKVSCDDYKTYYSDAFKSLYSSGDVPGCKSGATGSICIEDLCPWEINKTGDDDFDGVINCFDACKENPTKSDMKQWWDDVNGAGIRCDVMDTDRDGVDDSEDACPTRKSLSAKGADCGIQSAGDDHVPEFHIYNARDLVELREKLNELMAPLTCMDKNDYCTVVNDKDKLYRCVEGVVRTYACDECYNSLCTIGGEQNKIPEIIPVSLRIYLEDDINLDDVNDTIFDVKSSEKAECYGVWLHLPDMVAVEFDGKNHTISYRREDGTETGMRCNLMDSLFGNIYLSNIRDLKIDYGMKGYGRSLFASQVYGSTLSNIEVTNGLVETAVSDIFGVGSLAGSVGGMPGVESGEGSQLNGISVHLKYIEAPGASYVGGIAGNVNALLTAKIESKSESIRGKNYVGGMFGSYHGSMGMALPKNDAGAVYGVDDVGGAFGKIDTKIDISSYSQPSLMINRAGVVKGHDDVGGLAGYAFAWSLYKETSDKYWLYNHIEEVMASGQNTGGLVGNIVGDRVTPSRLSYIYNVAGAVKGNDNTGGVAGHLFANSGVGKYIYNKVGSVESASGSIGGVQGYVDTEFGVDYDYIYNEIKSIKQDGPGYVGGFAGAFHGHMGSVYSHVDELTAISSGTVSHYYLYYDTGLSGGLIGLYTGYRGNLDIEDVHSEVDSMKLLTGSGVNDKLIAGGFVGRLIPDRIQMKDVSSFVNAEVDKIGDKLDFGGFVGSASDMATARVEMTSVYMASSVKEKGKAYCCGLYGGACLPEHCPLNNISVYSACASPVLFNATGCTIDGDGVSTLSAPSDAFIKAAKTLNAESKWENVTFKLGDNSVSIPAAVSKEAVLRSLPAPDPDVLKEIGVTE